MSKHTQERALENAVRRNMPLDLESVIKHLIGECSEFLKGRTVDTVVLDAFPIDLCDKDFLLAYRAIKDSKIDELADLRIIPNTIAEILDIDLDKAEMLKHRFNDLR